MPFAIEIASFGNAAAPVSCGAVMGCPATGRRAPALRRRCSVRGGRSRLCAELQKVCGGMKIRRPLASSLRGVPGAAAVWLRGGGWRWPRRGVVRCAAPQRAAQSAVLALPPPGAGRCAALRAALESARPAPVLRWVPAATSAWGHGVWLVCAAAHVSRVLRHPLTPPTGGSCTAPPFGGVGLRASATA